MKMYDYFSKISLALATAFVLSCGLAHGADGVSQTRIEKTAPYSPKPGAVSAANPETPYDQLLMIQAGPYRPASISFTNWNNTAFHYDDASLGSFMAELGWGIRMFDVGSLSFYFEENLAYSSFSYRLPAGFINSTGNQSVTLHMFGLDSRLAMALDDSPVPGLIPFAEGGYQHTFYTQTASNDLLGGEGGAGNVTAGLGLRYWLNRSSSINQEYPGRYVTLPIFITAKLNHIFSNNTEFDPASTSILGGLSVGL